MWPRLFTQFWLAGGISCLIVMTSLNIASVVMNLRNRSHHSDHRYSYVGDDYPNELPVPIRPAMLTLGAHGYYDIESNGWHSMVPPQNGFIRLGPNGRAFLPTVYHQLHCVNSLRSIFLSRQCHDETTERNIEWHIQHCTNIVRQTILCNSDVTLEPEDDHNAHVFKYKNLTATSGIGTKHKCRDWEQLRSFIEENQAIW